MQEQPSIMAAWQPVPRLVSRTASGRHPSRSYDVPGVMNRDGAYSRVRRGGAWIEPAWACRSACRLRYGPPRRSDHMGFRVVAVESSSA